MTKLQAQQIERAIVALFDIIWDLEAKEGHCDARGGAEYQRVRQAYLTVGIREIITNYIRQLANEPAEPYHPWDREDYKL